MDAVRQPAPPSAPEPGEDRPVIAFYGGSFNPPHVAHAMVIAWLRWTRRVERVLVVPVYRHAFEGVHDKRLAPFADRLDWCRAMVDDVVGGADDGRPPVDVLDVEAHLPVPSYTIDTLRHLAARFPGRQLRPVVGADVLPQLPRWRDQAALQADFPPLIVGRAGYPLPDDAVVFPQVSSSDIRARLRQGQDARHLLPGGVADRLDPDTVARCFGPQDPG